MPKSREPLALTKLKNCKVMRHKMRQDGRADAMAVEQGMEVLDASAGMGHLARLATAEDWYRHIAGRLEAVGLLRAVDEPMLMGASRSLAQYGAAMTRAEAATRDGDSDEAGKWDAIAHRNLSAFTRAADKMGLSPASRARFLTQSAVVGALNRADKPRFNFNAIDGEFKEVKGNAAQG